MAAIEQHEKEYGTSEQSRLNAIFKMRELKRAGFVARVVYGGHMQFIVVWHKKNKPELRRLKKHKPIEKLTGVD